MLNRREASARQSRAAGYRVSAAWSTCDRPGRRCGDCPLRLHERALYRAHRYNCQHQKMGSDHPVEPARVEQQTRRGILDLIRNNPPELLFYLIYYLAQELLATPAVAWNRWRFRMQGKRAVGYVGWVGHRNLGDEALFDAVRRSLSDLPVIPFIAAPGESMLARTGLGGASVFRAVLLGGGTLIHPYYLPAAQLIRRFGLPLYTVGTGVGSPGFFAPQDSPLTGWKEILAASPLLSVRGPLSLQALHALGLAHAEVIGDPVLGLAPDTPPPFRSRQRLVINLAQEKAPATESAEYKLFRKVAELAGRFASDGGELVGVALGSRDRAVLEKFRKDNHLSGMRIEDHRTSAEGLFQTLSGSVALIGVRLHSAVFAACLGVPPLLIAYRAKCEDFMASMDLQDFAVPLSPELGPARLELCFNQVLSQPELGRRIYEKALFWKSKQQAFYSKLIERITR